MSFYCSFAFFICYVFFFVFFYYYFVRFFPCLDHWRLSTAGGAKFHDNFTALEWFSFLEDFLTILEISNKLNQENVQAETNNKTHGYFYC